MTKHNFRGTKIFKKSHIFFGQRIIGQFNNEVSHAHHQIEHVQQIAQHHIQKHQTHMQKTSHDHMQNDKLSSFYSTVKFASRY